MKEKGREEKDSSNAGPAVDREQDFPLFRIDVVTKSDKSLPKELRTLGNIEVQRKMKRDRR